MSVAVVTGGSRGLGRAFVVEAARRGYDVVFTHRGRAGDEARTVAACAGLPGTAIGVLADVARPGDLETVAAAANGHGAVHLLVNCAGVLRDARLADVTPEIWGEAFAVHVTAPMVLTRLLAPSLAASGGAVLNVSSDGGVVGSVHGAPYGASKAAEIGLTKTLARELAPAVRVNALAPGPISTDMWDAVPAQDRRTVEEETPLGRVGTPEEIARAGLDLCHWTYVTGQTVVVDGGRVMK